MISLCDFLEWSTDEITGFRKLIIKPFEVKFVAELTNFENWNGDSKECNKCNKNLPRVSYFFKLHPSNKKDRLHNTCKECQGSNFSWGTTKQYELIKSNLYYCTKCDCILPLNEIYFAKDKNRKTGFTVTCKKCVTYSSDYGIPRFLNEVAKVTNDMQVCLECLIELPRNQDYYFKIKKSSDVYESKCKKCQGCEYGIVKWNDIIRVKNKRYCVDCKEVKSLEEFYFKDKTNDKRYSRCNKCHYIGSQNRRHQQSNVDYKLEDWKFALNFFANENGEFSCAYCGIKTEQLEKEHILPFSKGGELSRANIIPACKSCNCSKCDKTLNQFYEYKESFSKELYYKIITYIELFNIE